MFPYLVVVPLGYSPFFLQMTEMLLISQNRRKVTNLSSNMMAFLRFIFPFVVLLTICYL